MRLKSIVFAMLTLLGSSATRLAFAEGSETKERATRLRVTGALKPRTPPGAKGRTRPHGNVQLELTDPAGHHLAALDHYENGAALPGRWLIRAQAFGYEQERREVEVRAHELTAVKLWLHDAPVLTADSIVTPGSFDSLNTPRDDDGLGGLGSRSREDDAPSRARTTPFLPGDITVAGGLSSAEVNRSTRQHWPEVRDCYEKARETNPDLEGKMVVTFEISAMGETGKAQVERSDLHDSQLEACVLARLRRWRYPASSNGGATSVNCPFVFELP